MTLEKNSRHNVFISYTRNDSILAERLAVKLSERSINSWLDKNEIPPGKNWHIAVQKALKNSSSMIALLSPNSYSSSWVREELKYALFDERFKNRLLPVFIGEFPLEEFNRLPWILTHIKYLKVNPKLSINKISDSIVHSYLKMINIRG